MARVRVYRWSEFDPGGTWASAKVQPTRISMANPFPEEQVSWSYSNHLHVKDLGRRQSGSVNKITSFVMMM